MKDSIFSINNYSPVSGVYCFTVDYSKCEAYVFGYAPGKDKVDENVVGVVFKNVADGSFRKELFGSTVSEAMYDPATNIVKLISDEEGIVGSLHVTEGFNVDFITVENLPVEANTFSSLKNAEGLSGRQIQRVSTHCDLETDSYCTVLLRFLGVHRYTKLENIPSVFTFNLLSRSNNFKSVVTSGKDFKLLNTYNQAFYRASVVAILC